MDLVVDVHNLLASSRFNVRKKATATVLRLLLECPDSVRIVFKKLVDNMECVTDQRIVSATVGVFCELSGLDPSLYLPLAPEFYKILVDSKNNWVLIKVLKIFARLLPLEPRLAKKIVEPISQHMRKTNAKSLVFECVRTVLSCLDGYGNVFNLALDKVKEFFISDQDSNLRYLGLLALSMLKPVYSWVVEENQTVIINSLDDSDPNIQHQALNLIMGLVNESNVIELSDVLVNQALKSDPLFANEILGALLSSCSRNFYELLVDFEWYVSLLGAMSRNPHCTRGEEIERQLVDIALRVKDVQPDLIQTARDLLIDPALLENPFLHRILSAAAWISGEFVEFSRNPFELVEALLQPRTNLLPTIVRAVYIQAVFKIIIFCYSSYLDKIENSELSCQNDSVGKDQVFETNSMTNSGCDDDSISNLLKTDDLFTYKCLSHMLNLIKAAVLPLSVCDEVEVQERARNVLGLVHVLQIPVPETETSTSKDMNHITNIVRLTQNAFSERLGPVPTNAQEKVPVPTDFELLDNLFDIKSILGEDDAEIPTFSSFLPRGWHHQETKVEESEEQPLESTSFLADHRKRHGVYYLSTEKHETVGGDEFPQANNYLDASITESVLDLTHKSLNPSSKSKTTKSRPVVIKLDGEESVLICDPKLGKKKGKDSLQGRDENAASLNEESTSVAKEISREAGHGNSVSRHHGRRDKKHRHSKHKNHLHENDDPKDGKHHKNPHSRYKHRKRDDDGSSTGLDVAQQSMDVPDLLL